MKQVILTGATGFVGANLARRLLNDGHTVHLLVRHGYAPWRIESIRDHVQLHEVDLGDPQAVSAVVARIKPDRIFHLAAYGAYSSQTDLARMVQTNIVGTINLVNACLQAGFEAFVNTGSSSEYGFKDHAPTENEWIDPNSHYAVTKASATHFCRYTARSKNVHLPTLRLYSVYGPYEEPSRLMPTLIQRGLRGELPPLVNPDIARDYVYTEDVNDAYLLAATMSDQEPGAVYNVGTGVQTTLRDVVDVARRIMGISVEPEWGSMPNRQWDTSVWVSDNRKIVTELGWKPRYTFEQGFRLMVDWMCDHLALYADQ
ncbi:MAG: SDR family NAD(P)-dependent oxidoreductase [Anaerolineae bacterium]|nr:SDR family NAD(P)-dependent oxidoreductase [Anaerolineae bacterium]